ncbi:uncharacterized protein ARMOST_08571 [Armillaria ostoyae]|uniref:F-box domain-containing protein n=1 Tax=Armillaria ostoyae TaxID=47428 RepID=A0A284R911_ARMOS|nr:uncharacterized protein ARMOST_08571 [Armillaria ostoyae]
MESASGPTKEVLCNSDLLGIICWFVRDTLGSKTLCALALTCHATRDMALDYLWQDISGMEPLLSIFPHTVSSRSNLPWIPPNAISDETWARFDRYSSRIRSITLAARSRILHSPTIFLRLAELKQEPLLPKLQKLIVDVAFAADTSVLLFLSSPLLDEVEITFPSDPEADMAPMSIWTVGWKVPGLRSLTFTHHLHQVDYPSPPEPVFPFSSFPHLRQLRKLNIKTYSVDFSCLVQLSSLPHLAELQVIVARSGNPQQRLSQIAFPSLESLDVAADVSLMPSILRLIRQGSLTSLTYRNWLDPNFIGFADSLQAFHAEIVSRFPSLTSLTLNYCPYDYTPPSREEDRESLRAVMQPLYDLSRLQIFVYNSVPCMHNDAVALRLATSWPEIRTLCVSNLLGTSPTYRILAALATHCPFLTRLIIPITFPENYDPLPDDGVFSHRLHTLLVYDGKVDRQHASVAHYLDRMFPFLVLVEGGEGWDLVESIILKACQPARWEQLQRLRG